MDSKNRLPGNVTTHGWRPMFSERPARPASNVFCLEITTLAQMRVLQPRNGRRLQIADMFGVWRGGGVVVNAKRMAPVRWVDNVHNTFTELVPSNLDPEQ